MAKLRIDRISRQILTALQEDPRATVGTIADKLGATQEVVETRMQKMLEKGVLRGFSVRVDPAQVGYPLEFLVTGAPSVETTKDALQALCHNTGVTRVFTLATQDSVAFTVSGKDIAETEGRAYRLAQEAGLERAQCTMIVQTLHDEPSAFLTAEKVEQTAIAAPGSAEQAEQAQTENAIA